MPLPAPIGDLSNPQSNACVDVKDRNGYGQAPDLGASRRGDRRGHELSDHDGKLPVGFAAGDSDHVLGKHQMNVWVD
jgi:hypothetical protein